MKPQIDTDRHGFFKDKRRFILFEFHLAFIRVYRCQSVAKSS